MSRKYKGIIDADKAFGPCDMTYDLDLAEAERRLRKGEIRYEFQPTNPVEIERQTDRFLKDELAKVR